MLTWAGTPWEGFGQSEKYRTELKNMYEQLCILGVCELANMDENGKFDLDACKLVAYSHGEYISLAEVLGTYGYTVRKESPYKF